MPSIESPVSQRIYTPGQQPSVDESCSFRRAVPIPSVDTKESSKMWIQTLVLLRVKLVICSTGISSQHHK